MPTSVSRVTIQSDLSQFADRFDLVKVGIDGFETAVPNQGVSIAVGYKGAQMQQLTGEADEWELQWTDRGVTGTKRGRDLGARLVDRQFRKTYFRHAPNPAPTTPYAVGVFTAKMIAAEIATAVGLTLDWTVPDYTIQDDTLAFTSSGGEAIKRLVQVMGQPEMYAIDVYTMGTTLIVRQRGAVPSAADYRLSAEDLMGITATYRKRPGPLYGTIRITGGNPGTDGTSIDLPPDEDLPREVVITQINETPPVWPSKGTVRVTTKSRILQSIANEVLLSETATTEIETTGGGSGGSSLGDPLAQGTGTVTAESLRAIQSFLLSDIYPSSWPFGAPSNLGQRLQNLYHVWLDASLTAPVGSVLTVNITNGGTVTTRIDYGVPSLGYYWLGNEVPRSDGDEFSWRVDKPTIPSPPPGGTPGGSGSSFGGMMQQVSETRKTIGYNSGLLLDQEGRIAIPLKLTESVVMWGIGASLEDWREVRRESTSYAYDEALHLMVQDTLIEELVGANTKDVGGVTMYFGGDMTATERRVVTNSAIDANQYQTKTEIFEITTKKNGTTGKLEIDPAMRIVATDIKVTRGQLPGPQRIRRPRKDPSSSTGGGGTPGNRVVKEVVISTDLDAVDVSISDSNITEAMADQLIAQYRAASGLWRHEVTLRHVALPFLTKGTVLGSQDALPLLGAPLPNTLIVSRKMDYDESGASPSFQADLTLAWWA